MRSRILDFIRLFGKRGRTEIKLILPDCRYGSGRWYVRDFHQSLNSFFSRWDRRDPQTAALRAWLAEYESEAPPVMVTHQVNINALRVTYTTSGEIVVVCRGQRGKMTVLGTF